jgi:hypothetical protein
MGHSAGFGYALWAIAQDLDIRYGQQRRIWLCAQTNYQMEEVQDNFLKACLILLRDCDDKNVCT